MGPFGDIFAPPLTPEEECLGFYEEEEEDVFLTGKFGTGGISPADFGTKKVLLVCWFGDFLRVQGMVFITKNYSSKGGSP